MGVDFTDREIILLINSTHERAMRLLDLASSMSQKTYKNIYGKAPAKEDIDSVFSGHKEHLALVDKLRSILDKND